MICYVGDMCSLVARKCGNCDDWKAVRPRSHKICNDKAKNRCGNLHLNEKFCLTILLLAACLLQFNCKYTKTTKDESSKKYNK